MYISYIHRVYKTHTYTYIEVKCITFLLVQKYFTHTQDGNVVC